MSKVLVVFWSGTGNTEIMAEKIAEGLENAGQEVDLKTLLMLIQAKLTILVKSHLVAHQWLMKN